MIKNFFYRRADVPVLLYAAAALLFSMASTGPIFSAVGLLCALVCRAVSSGRRALRSSVGLALPVILLLTIVNPLVNTGGLTVLFSVFDRPITVEATLYGLSAGMTLAAVLVWFAHFNDMAVSEKILGVFSGIFPTTALAAVLILRYIPALLRTGEQANRVRAALCGDTRNKSESLRRALRSTTIVLEKSLEDSAQTAKSMNARGYKRGMRRHKKLPMSASDKGITALLTVLIACTAALFFAAGSFVFFPYVRLSPWSVPAAVGMALLLLLPVLAEGKERLVWRLLK